MSSRRRAAMLALGLGLACRSTPREPMITYFNADHGVTLRYPSSWKTEQAEQDGVWYRYFLAPPSGPKRNPDVSVTLLVGALGGTVDQFAQTYLAGNSLASSHDETRGPAQGKSYVFQSTDGLTRHSLLLLKENDRVYGLYAQGEAPSFERLRPILEDMARSLNFERPELYEEHRSDRFGFSVRLPPSWKETRSFSGGGTYLLQFRSPPISADKDREPVHASLTLTVEPIADKGDVQAYYETVRTKLGESFQLIAHSKWKDGYVDMMRTETPVSVSRVKRFYRAADGRGYSLAFEAREDVFTRASKWCDLIAGTLKTGPELGAP